MIAKSEREGPDWWSSHTFRALQSLQCDHGSKRQQQIESPALGNKLKCVHVRHGTLTRATKNKDLVIPDVRNKLCEKNNFYPGCVNWNALSKELNRGKSYNSFKYRTMRMSQDHVNA